MVQTTQPDKADDDDDKDYGDDDDENVKVNVYHCNVQRSISARGRNNSA